MCELCLLVCMCVCGPISEGEKEKSREMHIQNSKADSSTRVEWNVQCTSLARGALYLQDAGKGI